MGQEPKELPLIGYLRVSATLAPMARWKDAGYR